MPTIMSGIEKIDAITGGFLPGELVLLCGRTEMGKTTLLDRIALNIAKKAVRDKNPEFVLYFGQTVGIPGTPRFRGIRNLQDEVIIGAYHPVLKIEDIVKNVQFQKKKRRLSVVAIDYLQLIGTKEPADRGSYRKESATDVVRRLKQLAVEESICILLVARVFGGDQIITLADLTKIGIVEPLADVVSFLHRPHHFNGLFCEIFPGPTTVTIAKNRHGGIGSCELRIKEFGISDMTYWTWRQSNLPQIASEIKDSMRRAANGRSIFTPQYQVNYYNIRYHLRWLFFGSPGDGKPDETKRHSNGYVVNGLRMNDDGFARLNAELRWQIAEDDPILNHDISECFMEFDQSRIPEQYNAICPLDGYVLAINAESYWRLPPGEHVAEDGPDSVYRLCPHCLMDLASMNIIRRCIRGVE